MSSNHKWFSFAGGRTLPSPLNFMAQWLRDAVLTPVGTVRRPTVLCLHVTYRCDSDCAMCGIGTSPDAPPDPSPAEIGWILADPLFNGIEHVDLNGGEPFLRPDLPQIVAGIVARFPRLHGLTVSTNGRQTDHILSDTATVLEELRPRMIGFSVCLSLHGFGPVHDRIVGREGAFEETRATLEGLRSLRERNRRMYLALNCVVSRLNIDRLEELRTWALRERVPIQFVPAEYRDRFRNEDRQSELELDSDGKARFLEFLRARSNPESLFDQHAFRYRELLEMEATGRDRRQACHYSLGSLIIGPEGSLYYCKKSRAVGNVWTQKPTAIYFDPANLSYRKNTLLGETCRTCQPNTFNREELRRDLGPYLSFFVKTRLGSRF
jgi:MoaA/NifB/PqqE/SkfB family radical SAM enzyme